jgi:hypothetical protein
MTNDGVLGALLAFTIPVALVAAVPVFRRLSASIKGKKALETAILAIAKSNPEKRAALAAAAAGEETAAAREVAEIVAQAASSLSEVDGHPVLRALEQARRQGNPDYVRDIVRHVDAQLTRTG